MAKVAINVNDRVTRKSTPGHVGVVQGIVNTSPKLVTVYWGTIDKQSFYSEEKSKDLIRDDTPVVVY